MKKQLRRHDVVFLFEGVSVGFSTLRTQGDIDDYEKNRNYLKYLKAKLKREDSQLGSVTTQFRFTALDSELE